MFSSTVDQLVKALGRNTLLPVPSIETADNISPLSLVIKEPTRYLLFWKKYKHYTTEFALKDILKGETDDLKIEQKAFNLTTYNVSTKLSLNGKFGVQLSKELFDIDVKTTDTVTVNSRLGDLEKVEVDLPSLIEALNDRKIDLKSRRIDSLVSQNNKVLGVVTAVIRLMNDAKLEIEKDIDVSGELDVKSAICEADAGATDDKTRSITLLKGTPLAYVTHDLLISTADGSFKVILPCDSIKGGFTPRKMSELDATDGPCLSFAAEEDQDIFKELMNLDSTKREEFRNIITTIMQLPRLILPISELMQRAETFIDTGIRRTTNLSSLNKKIGTVGDGLVPFLNLTGFHVEENGTVEYPLECSDMFESCQLLLSLMEELGDDEIEALVNTVTDVNSATKLLQIFRRLDGSEGESLTLSADEMSTLTIDTARQLMDVLKITVDEDSLTFSLDNIAVQACRLVLLAFYGSN